jgi:hypothetical protein
MVDYNVLALCSGAYKKPTHRGTKGYKRRHNIRQRIIKRLPYTNLKPGKLVEPLHHSKTTSKVPALLLTNCRSITLDKLDELRLLVEQQTPQIVMITESWLTDS